MAKSSVAGGHSLLHWLLRYGNNESLGFPSPGATLFSFSQGGSALDIFNRRSAMMDYNIESFGFIIIFHMVIA